jgi:hypothetical protein
MHRIIQSIFPTHPLALNFRSLDMKFVDTRKKAELDVYIPSLALAFEHQGEQHYGLHLWGQTQRVVKNDEEKRDICKRLGITLIEVPFWWNKSKEQMEAAIWRVRPDAVPEPSTFKSWISVTEKNLMPRSTLRIRIVDADLNTISNIIIYIINNDK